MHSLINLFTNFGIFIICLISCLVGTAIGLLTGGYFSANNRGPCIVMEKPEEPRPEDPSGMSVSEILAEIRKQRKQKND
jgi:hypothetical protein